MGSWETAGLVWRKSRSFGRVRSLGFCLKVRFCWKSWRERAARKEVWLRSGVDGMG